MEKYEVVLKAPDEYSSPEWVFFNAPTRRVRDRKKGEYSVIVTAENILECRQILDDWFVKGSMHVWR